MRLTVLGGSGVTTPQLADALVAWPGGAERRPELEVVLHGRSEEKLRAVAGIFKRKIATHAGADISVRAETDRVAALQGADCIVNQVRIGGLRARAFDESFPWLFGVPGEETMGPGGFANAVRTLPALRETWHDVHQVAPAALIINLTNPAGMVQQAAEMEFGLRVISVCDSPLTVCDGVAQRLGWERSQARRRYLGMNHLGWWVPESPEQVASMADLAWDVDPAAVGLHQAIPNNYVRYYVHPERILESQRGKPTRAQQLLTMEEGLLAQYRRGETPAEPGRGAVWYTRALLPLLDAWVNGSGETLIVGVHNQGLLTHLPAEVVLEVPAVFYRPAEQAVIPVVDLPPLPATLLAHHAAYEDLTVRAVLGGGSKEALTRALMANPMVRSYEQASGLLGLIQARETGT